ncbi:MAG: hypothetical protein ACREJQ_06110 [bacterium]
MKNSWLARIWRALLGLRIIEEKRASRWHVLINNTDAGPRERMFVVLLKDRTERPLPLLLTHSESHAKEFGAQVEADLASLTPEAFEAKYIRQQPP